MMSAFFTITNYQEHDELAFVVGKEIYYTGEVPRRPIKKPYSGTLLANRLTNLAYTAFTATAYLKYRTIPSSCQVINPPIRYQVLLRLLPPLKLSGNSFFHSFGDRLLNIFCKRFVQRFNFADNITPQKFKFIIGRRSNR